MNTIRHSMLKLLLCYTNLSQQHPAKNCLKDQNTITESIGKM